MSTARLPYAIRYQIARKIGVPKYIQARHPEIINADYIPKEGPIVLCGPHFHVEDQYPVICATERITYWMAKHEYKYTLLGPLLSNTGAIYVKRGDKSDTSKQTAIERLDRGGAVGIFLEGTRNIYEVARVEMLRAKKRYDFFTEEIESGNLDSKLLATTMKEISDRYHKAILGMQEAKEKLESRGYHISDDEIFLPFFPGAVSMAKATGAKLVPFCVTGSFAKENNDLTVEFAKPLEVGNRLVDEVHGEVKEKCLTLYKKNLII